MANSRRIGGGVWQIVEKRPCGGMANSRGKLPRITQACGNSRFARSGRFEKWGGPEGPGRPAEAVRGDPSGGKGETSGPSWPGLSGAITGEPGASAGLCHGTSVLLLAARRHFLHDGSAVSTCSRGTKSPHSVQAAPSGASLVGSVMWVFGFAIEIGRLTPTEAPPPCGAPLLGLPESYRRRRHETEFKAR